MHVGYTHNIVKVHFEVDHRQCLVLKELRMNWLDRFASEGGGIVWSQSFF